MTTTDRQCVDPYAPEYLADPHAVLGSLRADEPVAWIDAISAFMVTRNDLVAEVLADTGTYSNHRPADGLTTARDDDVAEALADIRSGGWPHRAVIADEDPPVHDAFRSIVAPFFTPSRVRSHYEAFAGICDRLIDRFAGATHIEFVQAFAKPLPLHAINLILDLGSDITTDQLDAFARWRDSAVVAVGADVPKERLLEAERDIVEMQQFLAARLAEAGTDDGTIFGALRRGRVPAGDGGERPLEVAESLTILRQVFVGGIETTTKALAQTMLQLDDQPELFSRLADDAELRRRVVEESLRLSSPAQGILRTTTRAARLGNVDLPARARVFVMFAAANRDHEAFPDADTFDPTRAGLGRHFAFGRGVHVCLGAAVARVEMQAALERLSARLTYRIRPSREVAYNPSFLLRGPLKVHMDIVSKERP